MDKFDASRLTDESAEWLAMTFKDSGKFLDAQFAAAVAWGRRHLADGIDDAEARAKVRRSLEVSVAWDWTNRAVVRARGSLFDEVARQAWAAVESARAEIVADLERAEAARIADEERARAEAKRAVLRARLTGAV